MKNLFTLLFCLILAGASAQSKWAFHTSAEETVLFGDQRSSLNFASLTNLAANSGIRFGMYRQVNDMFGVEATLGVVGTSRPNAYVTKFVPVEVVGHYNILPSLGAFANSKNKLNVDFGLGSALVRPTSPTYNTGGSFSFSENASVGLSIDLPVLPNGVLSLGYRHTAFVDDWIDTDASGGGNDYLGRAFMAARWNLGASNKDKEALAAAITKSDQLAAELKAAESKAKAMEKSAARAKALERKLKEMEQAMADSIAAAKTAMAEQEMTDEAAPVPARTGSGFAVIVASYKNEAGAQKMAEDLGGSASVIAVPELGRFRVAYDVLDSYSDAKALRESLLDDFADCWIIGL